MGTGLLQPVHLIILLVIALVVLGPKRLPEVGKSLGAGMRGFRDSISGADEPDEIHVQSVASDVPVAAPVAQAEAAPVPVAASRD
jgi:sec-independent protein translocase protein TatA